ncbi:MAG: hypothetical protein Q9226_002743 [Calogaya cf. arnoldii]
MRTGDFRDINRSLDASSSRLRMIPKYFHYDYYDMAQIFSSGLLHPDYRQERDILGPIFMFVHGKSFQEMVAEKQTEEKYHTLNPFRKLSERSPWSAELGKQAWRLSEKKGKRSGGRKNRRPK